MGQGTLDLDLHCRGFCLRLLNGHSCLQTGALGRIQTSNVPKGIPGYSRIVSIVSPASAKWRRAGESNAHPEGAPIFKTGRITINSALQKLLQHIGKRSRQLRFTQPHRISPSSACSPSHEGDHWLVLQSGGPQWSSTTIPKEPSFSRRVGETSPVRSKMAESNAHDA